MTDKIKEALYMVEALKDDGRIAYLEYETIRNALQSQEWKEIDSAPRDGTWILGYWPSMPITQFPKTIFADDCSENDIWFMPDNIEFGCVYPTHWMPLPTAPKVKE